MTLFNWFFRRAGRKALPRSIRGDGVGGRKNKTPAPPESRPEADTVPRGEARKAKRHARREQLYVAVREAMTRSGVLASTYKFKVLSLEQQGNQFLVMADVAQALGRQPDKLADIEGMITQTAKARFRIQVTAVYWRIEAGAIAGPARPAATDAGELRAAVASEALQPPPLKSALRYEPIQDDEVAAFKQALVAASAANPVPVEAGAKSRRSGLHSYTLLTGFEDTEMPESGAVPALSTTQYGDLN